MLLFRWMLMLTKAITKELTILRKFKGCMWMSILLICVMKSWSCWLRNWEKEMPNIMPLWLKLRTSKRECKIRWGKIHRTLINRSNSFKSTCSMEIKSRRKLRRQRRMRVKRRRVQRELIRLNNFVSQDKVQILISRMNWTTNSQRSKIPSKDLWQRQSSTDSKMRQDRKKTSLTKTTKNYRTSSSSR